MSIKRIQKEKKLKMLRKMIAELSCEVDDLKVRQSEIQKEAHVKQKKLQELIIEEKKLTEDPATKEVDITDHAVLRFMERVMKVDLQEIKKQMLPDAVKNQIETLGNGRYPISSNAYVIIKNGSAVSVISSEDYAM